MAMTRKFADKIALVTGASRGIGRAVAKKLAAEGAHVILIARTTGGLEELDDEIRAAGGSATLVPLDLKDHASIDGLAAPLLERYGRLDILVADAGMLGRLTPLAQFPPELWEQMFAVNVHANWRLIRALDPLLRAAPAGRAIFVTSGASRSLKAYWGGYATTKAALDAMVKVYAEETAKTNLRVNLLNPGATRTSMRAQAFPGEDVNTLKSPEALLDVFMALADPACTLHGEWVQAVEWLKEAKRAVH